MKKVQKWTIYHFWTFLFSAFGPQDLGPHQGTTSRHSSDYCSSMLRYTFFVSFDCGKTIFIYLMEVVSANITYSAVEMTQKASPLNNRSVRRTCGSKNIVERTLKECPNNYNGLPHQSRCFSFTSPGVLRTPGSWTSQANKFFAGQSGKAERESWEVTALRSCYRSTAQYGI